MATLDTGTVIVEIVDDKTSRVVAEKIWPTVTMMRIEETFIRVIDEHRRTALELIASDLKI